MFPKRDAALPLWVIYPLLFAGIYFSHLTLLRLPYFWDEAGYYIPAALDYFRIGSLIPFTTITNAHPPLPSILMAGWWHIAGYVPSATRTLCVMLSAAALLAVFRMGHMLAGTAVAWVTVLLTAAYSIWYAQSTLAHADIFAAAFTLWALSFYLESLVSKSSVRHAVLAATLFSLAAIAKETAIVTPAALAGWELLQGLRTRRLRWAWVLALAFPLLPLLGWYFYHQHKTGYMFGNPEFVRYNATATLDVKRIALSFYHRVLHLTTHMNMWVATVLTTGVFLLPPQPSGSTRRIAKPALAAIGVILLINLLEFSVLGGALLTRYLLPCFPLLLLVYVSVWQHHFRQWWLLAGISFAGFVAAIFINPPYAFAPEDNLTYRDFVVLHQQAINVITQHYPQATVLTAWPAWTELMHPDLGYVKTPVQVTPIQNFSLEQVQQAAQHPERFDTALVFSTKYEPATGKMNFGKPLEGQATRYFDFHRDLLPAEAAALLHGKVVWQGERNGEWAAVIRFPRLMDASVQPQQPSKHL
ncbi:ArnT family glycosyltransferase [Terriglobus tenax]|uniref:ArnT family glycosyltransferase n=1 Tax=Terriglobus tenax TaxID=1111115 RepID=UPI0021DF6B58|nr:glycosyltransferase family 39 protein [Terriglobus tenax]